MSKLVKASFLVVGIVGLAVVLTGCTSQSGTQTSGDIDSASVTTTPSSVNDVGAPPVPPEPTRPAA